MKTKMKLLLVIVSLSLTLSLMSNTYSRYVADATGDLNVQFAPWKIMINDTDIIENKETSIALEPVILNNENTELNKIAPNSKGYFDIDVDPTTTGTSFYYQITLDSVSENMPDFLINKYTILDDHYIEGDETEEILINDKMINGEVNISDDKFNPFTIRVYFEWYDGEDNQMDDEQDTLIANTNEEVKIQATIKFTQKV